MQVGNKPVLFYGHSNLDIKNAIRFYCLFFTNISLEQMLKNSYCWEKNGKFLAPLLIVRISMTHNFLLFVFPFCSSSHSSTNLLIYSKWVRCRFSAFLPMEDLCAWVGLIAKEWSSGKQITKLRQAWEEAFGVQ